MKFSTSSTNVSIKNIAFPALLSVLAAVIVYNNYFTVLDTVKDGIIGIATYEGVDVTARIHRFYFAGITFAVSLFTFRLIYFREISNLYFRAKEKILINALATLSLITIVATSITEPDLSKISRVFIGITFTTILLIIFSKQLKLKLDLTQDKIVFALISAIIGYILITDTLHFFKLPLVPSWDFILISILYLGVIIGISKYRSIARLFYVFMPLFAIPLLFALSSEVYYFFLKRNINVHQGIIYSILFVLFWIWSIVRFKRHKTNEIRKTKFQVGLLLVICASLTVFYEHTSNWTIEDFELANPANAMMNIFKFNQIPIVDFYSSHLLSEQFYGALYFFIFGYNGSFDFLVYEFLVSIFSYTVTYCFLHHVFKNGWIVVFFILFFPFLPKLIFTANYFPILLCFLAMAWYMRQPIRGRFAFLVITLVLTTFWRVDNAVVAFPAVALCLLLWAYENKSLVSLGKVSLFSLISLLVITAGVAGILQVSGHHISDNFRSAFEYIGASQAHGFGEIMNGNAYNLHTAYFFLPIVVIFLSMLSWYFYRLQKITLKDLIIIIFFSIVYVLNFQRGLVRHTIGNEGVDKFFVSFLYFLIPYCFIVFYRVKKHKLWIFSIVGFLFLMAFKTPHPQEDKPLINEALNKIFQRHILDEKTSPSRHSGSEEYKTIYAGFRKFMNVNFPADASFIDMSNTPLLYYTLQRQVPGYFCQYIQNMVTASTQERDLKQLNTMYLPIAIFSSYPKHDFFDKTDGVENTIRYHKIANYIFNHYRPLGVMDGKYLWLKKDIKILALDNTIHLPDSIIYETEHFDIQKLAYLWAKGKSNIDTQGIFLKKDTNGNWQLPPHFSKINGNYIKIDLENNTGKSQMLKTAYFQNGKERGAFSFWVSDQKSAFYLVPVSTQYNWYVCQPDCITVQMQTTGLVIKSVSLFGNL
ncbi:MAG: hypothetical protein JSS64_10455 [Bacteroidetes bacterium]|nr:hypothetical protein [Bacteroidota bacterium]